MFRALHKIIVFLPAQAGEVSEWSKEHAWKVCILQKGIEGSNPSFSAAKNPFGNGHQRDFFVGLGFYFFKSKAKIFSSFTKYR